MEKIEIFREPFLEIACFDHDSAVNAAKGGASRIELCQDYASGGLSADAATLATLKSRLSIPIFAMIRPHPRNFYYSDLEFQQMKDTLEKLKSLGADGFVFGILQRPEMRTKWGWIDIERNRELVRLAEGRPCTFHRAFDLIPEFCWDRTLAELAACGFSSILTSGGSLGNQATDHTSALARLYSRQDALNTRQCIEIIIGGGVRSMNIQSLSQVTGGKSFHSSALVDGATVVSTEETRKMCEILDMKYL